MRDFVRHLLEHPNLGPMIAHHRRVPGVGAQFGTPDDPVPETLARALEGQGITRLYSHQVESLEAVRSGENLLAVTPTASGKTLVFAVPVLEGLFVSRGRAPCSSTPRKRWLRTRSRGSESSRCP